MPKYRDYFKQMIAEHETEFKAFKPIHDSYVLDPAKNQTEFNQKGEAILRLIEEYENRLCSHAERGEFGKFSHRTADAFRAEVRKFLPKYEDIGLEVEYVKPSPTPQSSRAKDALDDMFSHLKKTTF